MTIRVPFINRHFLKFPDNSVIVSWLQDGEIQHGPVLDYFVKLYDEHYLKLNINKAKYLVIDLRITIHTAVPAIISGSFVETGQFKVPGNNRR